jgi:hypothetical protein
MYAIDRERMRTPLVFPEFEVLDVARSFVDRRIATFTGASSASISKSVRFVHETETLMCEVNVPSVTRPVTRPAKGAPGCAGD